MKIGRMIVTGAASLTLAGCVRTHSTSLTTTTKATTTTTASSTSLPTTTSSTSIAASPTSASPSNLAVTDQVRAQLVAAGASYNNVPASDYSGLEPGLTYYAYDPASDTYWAGAGLVGATYRAQVSTQDDGSYMIFHHTGNGTWVVKAVGMAGGSLEACPSGTPPAAIVAVWGWPPGSCKPHGA
jgi:hypothetical protein